MERKRASQTPSRRKRASGSSKKARKTYLRMVQNVQLTGFVLKMARIDNPVIRFTEEDVRRLHHPHDDALVVSIWVRDYNTHQVLVDNGSSSDILYYLVFQQMRIDRKQLIPVNMPLVGFGGTRVHPLVYNGWRLLAVDHQGCHIPSCRLFIRLQCHIGSSYP